MTSDSNACKAELALANRILFGQGVFDAFGHVSVRDPIRSDRFLISKGKAPALVEAEDILSLDLDGQLLSDQGERSYLERFIHAGIYRARPDVRSIVHSHSPAVVPFTVSRHMRLKPVCHMSGFLRSSTPLFEIRDHAGPASDLLVRSPALGAALATCLRDAAVVLMRGHGCTVVGSSLLQAVFRAVYTEKNARIQTQAEALGEVEFLTDAEAQAADESNDGQAGRAWEFWALQARSSGFRTTPT
jgi:ribulose-5-phosphate 4-epimerase/fuculose-1-phosphate aldolase